jgi:transcription-repair coupling factor (superfamily II helicase)
MGRATSPLVTHPAIRDLLQSLNRDSAFQEAVSRLTRNPFARLSLSGLTTSAKALYLVLLWQLTERNLIVVVDGNKEAETLGELVDTFFDLLVTSDVPRPQTIPALDVLPSQHLSPHTEISEQRAVGLWRLASHKTTITITPVASALLRTEPAEFYRQLALTLRVGEEIPLEELLAHLENIGYEKRDPVEMVGEYSLRGGILDIFPAEASKPIRIELFGDLIESIRRFDVDTQRSVMKIAEVTLLPLAEYPKSREVLRAIAEQVDVPSPGDPFPGWEFLTPLARPRAQSLFTLVENPLVVLDEPEQVAAAAGRLWKRLDETDRAFPCQPEKNFYAWPELHAELESKAELALRELELVTAATAPDANATLASRPSLAFHGNIQAAIAEARNLVEQGYRVIFFAQSSGELERLADIFQEYSVPFQLGLDPADATRPYLAERSYVAGAAASTLLVKGHVRRGVVFPDARIALFGSEDLFDASDLIAKQGPTKSQLAAFTADIADLKPGDYVVHTVHGIGRFLGTREIAQGENKGDFMLIEYAAEAKLYVPLTRLDLVQKYGGAGEGVAPPLDRLGGATWSRTKSRVKAKMRDMADELLKLYAQRHLSEGFSFSADGNWQREFEDAFEFSETKDQLAAIKQIKKDMESAHPMDRLLCGDVGYGKTEVAMRAAFKALGDGKQIAILAPTTVLAYQHYETLKRRFAPFPVHVQMLSRFRDKREIAEVIAGLAEGKVDIVVGTHRLLSQDVQFHDLGLLVVDEEQRFGVRHKERIKQLRHNVDVLTMSATPIPRTLEMAVTGIREMSTITTPPEERHPVLTFVGPYEDRQIGAAIRRELLREGQVFYIHNRVESIDRAAARLREIVPEARIATAHGQMGESQLEQVVVDFWEKKFDVLVSTTIVESGIDIANANTLIVERGDTFGLSQLHQLRGRVGRSRERGYAYFLYPPEKPLTETAHERLATIAQHTEMGAGMYVAMKDLEIRGAGNLLGGEQSGHIAGVGFDLYVRMVGEAVADYRSALESGGEPEETLLEVKIELPVDAHVPHDYAPGERLRLQAYRAIAAATSEEDIAAVREELTDRYGKLPEPVENLLLVAGLRMLARKVGVGDITLQGANVRFGPVELRESQELRLQRVYPRSVIKHGTHQVLVPRPATARIGGKPLVGRDLLRWTAEFLTTVLDN